MKASVIIPTYNRSHIVEMTLRSLVGQDIGKDNYEVIVIDDGSSDNTREVVESFRDKLHLTYYFQEDKGYRVALARNEGIRRAQGDVLIFLDSGMVVGHWFVSAHYHAHAGKTESVNATSKKKVVIGYVYGYDHEYTEDCIPEIVNFDDPDTTLKELERTRQYLDIRERVYALVADDTASLPAPWTLFWTTNVSVERTLMLEAGCFDEEYVTWGMEDVECGYRLFHHEGVYEMSREACGVHYPHGRESYTNIISNERNKRRFFKKHQNIDAELYMVSGPMRFNMDYTNYLLFCKQVGMLPKYSELLSAEAASFLVQTFSHLRNIVFGCQDGFLLSLCRSAAGLESNPELVKIARANNQGVDIQSLIGCQTFHAAKQFDASLVAAAGWCLPEPMLSGMIKEAARISKKVFWLRTSREMDVPGIKCRPLKDLGNGIVLYELTEMPRKVI